MREAGYFKTPNRYKRKSSPKLSAFQTFSYGQSTTTRHLFYRRHVTMINTLCVMV